MTTRTNITPADILYTFGIDPVRAAKLCLQTVQQCDRHAATVYAEMAVDYARLSRVARRARARVYKSNDYTSSDPAIESVFDRSWHSALRCIKRAFALMRTA